MALTWETEYCELLPSPTALGGCSCCVHLTWNPHPLSLAARWPGDVLSLSLALSLSCAVSSAALMNLVVFPELTLDLICGCKVTAVLALLRCCACVGDGVVLQCPAFLTFPCGAACPFCSLRI